MNPAGRCNKRPYETAVRGSNDRQERVTIGPYSASELSPFYVQ